MPRQLSWVMLDTGVTRGLSQGSNFADGGPFDTVWERNIEFPKIHIAYYTYIGIVFACLRYIYVSVRLHAHLVRDEWHIQRHANREVAAKDTRITQKWLFIAQYRADVAL